MSNCSQHCANISGSEACYCVPGYQLDVNDFGCSGLMSFYYDQLREIVFQTLMNVLKIHVITIVLTLMVPLHVHVTMDMS